MVAVAVAVAAVFMAAVVVAAVVAAPFPDFCKAVVVVAAVVEVAVVVATVVVLAAVVSAMTVALVCPLTLTFYNFYINIIQGLKQPLDLIYFLRWALA